MLGSLVHCRPWFPSRSERAALVKNYLPPWAVASGITAGWVWTGMGSPEPWCVLREEKPGISPIERIHWRARIRGAHHQVTSLNELRIVTPLCTVKEILRGEGQIDVCATQIMVLSDIPSEDLAKASADRRASATERMHRSRVLARLDYLRFRYPDITR